MIRRLKWKIFRKIGGLDKLLLWSCIGSCVVTLYFVSKLLFAPSSRQVWDVSAEPENIPGEKCGTVCPTNQLAFYVKTGVENTEGPTICYDGKIVMSQKLGNTHRGINAVFIDYNTRKIIDIRVFDTYEEDYPFLRYMTKNVPDKSILMIASYDEISENLKEDGRQWLKLFGSAKIDDIGFRDSYVLIGHKGLQRGHAIEYLKTNGRNYAETIEKKGCFSLPMGPESELKIVPPSIIEGRSIQQGVFVKNCGHKHACKDKSSFTVMVHTGDRDQAVPKICVNEKMLMSDKLNDAGRGFNVVIIDPVTKSPKSVSRFDTYQQDSIGFESFLEDMGNGDIIVAVASDDASRKLTDHAKETLNKMGSSMIQNLKFRDVWYFVSKKGIDGFTPMEQISYAGYDGEWPKPLHKTHCVPTLIKGTKVPPEPQSYRNDERRAFCKKYDGYADFCDSSNIDDPLKPVGLVDKSVEKHSIFKTPIIIIPGMNHNTLVRTLETTLMQPGINPSLVVVAWDEKFPEHAELADVFKFKNMSLTSSLKYSDQMSKAVLSSWKQYSDAEHIIFIEEDLILAPDFLSFMDQCMDILNGDTTLYGISAWNFNGYDTVSGDRELIYRVEEFPGLAFMLKKSAFEKFIKPNMKECCKERAWDGWKLKEGMVGEIIIPDVSRVYRQPFQSSNQEEEYLEEMFHKPRLTNLEGVIELKGLQNITIQGYDRLMIHLLTTSKQIPIDELAKCITTKNYQLYLQKSSERTSYAVFYQQDKKTDYTLLRKICQCFGLYSAEGQLPRNLHKGIIRFFYQGQDMVLVASSSQFSKYKPRNAKFFSKKDIGGG